MLITEFRDVSHVQCRRRQKGSSSVVDIILTILVHLSRREVDNCSVRSPWCLVTAGIQQKVFCFGLLCFHSRTQHKNSPFLNLLYASLYSNMADRITYYILWRHVKILYTIHSTWYDKLIIYHTQHMQRLTYHNLPYHICVERQVIMLPEIPIQQPRQCGLCLAGVSCIGTQCELCLVNAAIATNLPSFTSLTWPF